ncbi:MAG TPA: flagellar basal body P-ring formation chaperone FlgA [Bryobacteraceae bacterium]|nr:flagellar basal body P-ring formation chaperone FlgA [Bryobacteraceae bacterium]
MIPLLFALSCAPVDGPKLLARHLAGVVEEFGSLPANTELGYAPSPGATRVIHAVELQSIGRRHGLKVDVNPEPVCFEWQMAPLDEARVIQAMRRSLPEDAQIVLSEVSRVAAPAGDIVFPLDSLKAGLWAGYIQYSGTRRFNVWARVRVTLNQTRVVAATLIKAGEPLTPERVRLEQFESEPDLTFVRTLEEAYGRITKAPLAEGAPVIARMLGWPAAVLKGDTVRLHAKTGAAQITIEAHAQASGRIGEVIPVKNPTSGRIIRALINGSGEVTWTP